MSTIYHIKTAIVCSLTRELLRNNHYFKAIFKFFASLDANNSLAIYLPDMKFRRFIATSMPKMSDWSIIKQASYEALKCVASIAWFYGSPQRVAFLTFTERHAIGAKRYDLERNSVE